MSSFPKKTASVATNNRIAAQEVKTSTITPSLGLDSSGTLISGSTPYISSAATLKAAAETLANKLSTIENTFTSQVYVDTQISTLIGGAPSTLDTLKEIADSIANDTAVSVSLISTVTAGPSPILIV